MKEEYHAKLIVKGLPAQQENIKEQILEWNSYLPEVKKQSVDVLVANIISIAVAQREKELKNGHCECDRENV